MAFEHASAPFGQRVSPALPADNVKPDRVTIMKTLSRAASPLGLGPSVVATVDALLSCLPPKRNHDVVYASNATLVLRRNGISDRTLRRHLAELVDIGLMIRVDSPNGKRYAKRNPSMGTAMRFGLNLAPLFAAYDKLATLADKHTAEIQRADYLRTKLRSIIRQMETTDRSIKTSRGSPPYPSPSTQRRSTRSLAHRPRIPHSPTEEPLCRNAPESRGYVRLQRPKCPPPTEIKKRKY